MHESEINDPLYEEPDCADQLFTPDVIAEIDRNSAEIKAGGKSYSMDEVREHFEKKRKEAQSNTQP